jgi:outer membrane receptor protein involved in Fe transport
MYQLFRTCASRIPVIVTLLSLLSFASTAQMPASGAMQGNFIVKGNVVDEGTGTPLEFATVALKRMRDSSLVSGTITNGQGEFTLENLPPGGFQMEIAFIGYERYFQRVIIRPQGAPPVTDLGVIKLKMSAKLLEGAEITADKSFIINNIDKKTYNTDQLAVATGGNVKDVLENLPSVEVDADGAVSLRGNANVTILIDGRPSGMTGSGGKSLLESIPASAIENIEVITNPSAKYDPDGISGIINIVTKKNKLVGFTGNVGLNTAFENRYGGNLSLSYRKGPWNVYGNYGYNKDIRKFTGDSYRETYFGGTTEILTQEEGSKDFRNNHNLKTGVDFNINDRNTISASVLYNTGDEDENEWIYYREFDAMMNQDSLYKRFTRGTGLNTNVEGELAFRHYFKQKGRILNVIGTASLDESSEDQEYDQVPYYNDLTPAPYTPAYQRDYTDEKNAIYTASADYEHPIGETRKVEAGYKATIREFDTDYRAEEINDTTGTYFNDINRTNQFIYRDQLHAIYAQYRQSIKKFGYQVGVRSEIANTESELITTNEFFTKDYFSIFPSAFVTYKPNEKSQFKASYSKRINRPSRRALNPFTNYEDPLNIRKGNPFLEPEYTDSYELEYNRMIGKMNVTTTGYARFTTDYIQRYREVRPDGVTVVTFQNLTSARNYGMEFIVNGSPYKWWNLTFSSNIYRNELDATNLEDNLSSVSMAVSGRIFSTFKLPYKTDLQLTYFYRAPMELPQGTMKDMQMTTIAVSKKVWKDRGVISARLSDPFDLQRFGFEFEEDTYYQDFTRKRQSRIFTLSFSYRFGELRDRDGRRQRMDQQPREDMDMGF